mmetsp:Transcript_12256/g.37386  ORF Transcript_12256/g.37386 Transcript_12256/m.37386 type:complete len:582 (-) Transcript_12256:3299-5044(-)
MESETESREICCTPKTIELFLERQQYMRRIDAIDQGLRAIEAYTTDNSTQQDWTLVLKVLSDVLEPSLPFVLGVLQVETVPEELDKSEYERGVSALSARESYQTAVKVGPKEKKEELLFGSYNFGEVTDKVYNEAKQELLPLDTCDSNEADGRCPDIASKYEDVENERDRCNGGENEDNENESEDVRNESEDVENGSADAFQERLREGAEEVNVGCREEVIVIKDSDDEPVKAVKSGGIASVSTWVETVTQCSVSSFEIIAEVAHTKHNKCSKEPKNKQNDKRRKCATNVCKRRRSGTEDELLHRIAELSRKYCGDVLRNAYDSEKDSEMEQDYVPSKQIGRNTNVSRLKLRRVAPTRSSCGQKRRSFDPPVPSSRDEIMEYCQYVLDQLCSNKVTIPFRKPVRVADAPRYYEIINRPMDLETVQNRLSRGAITDPMCFQNDLLQICQNALVYNLQGSDLVELALELKTIIIRKTTPLIDAWKRVSDPHVNAHPPTRVGWFKPEPMEEARWSEAGPPHVEKEPLYVPRPQTVPHIDLRSLMTESSSESGFVEEGNVVIIDDSSVDENNKAAESSPLREGSD